MKHIALSLASTGVLFVTVSLAQQAVLRLTATSVNVSEPGNNVRIEILRWSTDQERNQLVTALTPPAPPPAAVPAPPEVAAPTAGAEAAPTRGGRGGARGGAAGARGAGARGGRGGNNAAAVDPIAAFTAAIGRAPTIGYIWTNEVTGYSIKHRSEERRVGKECRSWE